MAATAQAKPTTRTVATASPRIQKSESYRVLSSMLSLDNPEKLIREDVHELDHTKLVRGDVVHQSVLGEYLDRFVKVGAIEIYYGPISPIMPLLVDEELD